MSRIRQVSVVDPYELIDADIDEEYAAAQEGQMEGQTDRFVVDSLTKAAWAVRKMQSAQERINERMDLVQKQIEGLQEWARAANTDDHNTLLYMEQLLLPYTLEQVQAAGGRKKSITVPGARLGFTAQQPDFQRDDDLLIAWAMENGMREELVQTKMTLRWAELKKMCRQVGGHMIAPTGEILPSLTSPHG